MSNIAIRVENLSKLYHIGRAQQRHDTLRDALVSALPRITRISRKDNSNNSSNSWQKRGGNSWQEETNLWALRDISFEVQRGEVVGIIGRNGAGKSTLLKILSRITEPTSGRAEIHGRVASLLEVGTGFHPELTGRENIYLNGAILGMRRAEIERKFDEIVAFAEIERFLDTPVKRYSSGMYVRLAFAVAAHLEPEILLVDEVLAVGDAAFQKKCLGKMGDVAKEGRTVLFVSHNMEAIEYLCSRAVWLQHGRATEEGVASDVVHHYMGALRGESRASFRRVDSLFSTKEAWISAVDVLADNGSVCEVFLMGEPIRFRISFELQRPCDHMEIGLVLSNDRGQVVAQPNSRQQLGAVRGHRGTNQVECMWQGPVLTPKRYFLRVDIGNYYRDLDSVDAAVSFLVEATDFFRTGRGVNPNPAVVSQCKWITRNG